MNTFVLIKHVSIHSIKKVIHKLSNKLLFIKDTNGRESQILVFRKMRSIYYGRKYLRYWLCYILRVSGKEADLIHFQQIKGIFLNLSRDLKSDW